MKLGRIALPSPDGSVARLVVVQPEKGRVIDLASAAALHYAAKGHATTEAARRLAQAAFPGSMAQALATGDYLLDHANDVVNSRSDDASLSIDKVEWLPASDPPVLRDGLNFIGHIKGWSAKMGREVPDSMRVIPGYTQMSNSMTIGHNATVDWPGYINRMDYELELGWVIGRPGRNLRPENALDCLFGVTLYNDFSGRDLQGNELPIGMGGTKSKQFAHGIGPWITTKDEFKDLYTIPMEVRLNGKTIAKGNSGGNLWGVDELLAYISLGEWLQPGDVIGSGTMGGGSALEHDIQIQPGDVVELEAGGVGVLRNTFGPKVEGLWWPEKRAPF
jgi:2-keto-4-pentenoate hydratase/2-oxohepta-3-ene-1,7-dioic acid hydratase in catechol pathway